MKNLIKHIFTICISMLLVIACTTNDYEEPNNTNGRILSFNSANTGFLDEVTQIRVDSDTINFQDLSLGVNSRKWTFPANTVDILGSPNNTTTDLQSFDVIFRRPGKIDVVLEPQFSGPVSEDQKMSVTSFDALPQIVAAFSTDLPSDGNVFLVEAGTEVTFTNNSSEKNNAEWKIVNVTKDREEELITTIDLTFLFRSLGDYVIGLRAFDEAPFSSDVAVKTIRVIPSSKPLVLDPIISENREGEIILQYSRDLDITTLDPISSFTLVVDGAPATIASVEIDPDNLANVVVTPEVNIKNTQTATLTYEVNTLISEDEFVAPSLPLTEVSLFNPNVFIKDPTFEDGQIQWGAPFGNDFAGVERKLVSPGNDSDTAMSVTINAGNNFQLPLTNGVEFTAGNKISLQFDYLLPSTFGGGGAQWNTRMYGADFSDDFRTFYGTCCGLVADGTWRTITIDFVGSGGAGTVVAEDGTVNFFLQIIAGDSTETEILFDNFIVKNIEE